MLVLLVELTKIRMLYCLGFLKISLKTIKNTIKPQNITIPIWGVINETPFIYTNIKILFEPEI